MSTEKEEVKVGDMVAKRGTSKYGKVVMLMPNKRTRGPAIAVVSFGKNDQEQVPVPLLWIKHDPLPDFSSSEDDAEENEDASKRQRTTVPTKSTTNTIAVPSQVPMVLAPPLDQAPSSTASIPDLGSAKNEVSLGPTSTKKRKRTRKKKATIVLAPPPVNNTTAGATSSLGILPNGDPSSTAEEVLASYCIADGVKWTEEKEVSDNVEGESERCSTKFEFIRPREFERLYEGEMLPPMVIFLCVFPWDHWKVVIEETKAHWPKPPDTEAKESTDKGKEAPKISHKYIPPNLSEFIKFLGIILCMSLGSSRGARRDHWATEDDGDDIDEPPLKYGERFKMSRDRFDDIMRYMRWGKFDDSYEYLEEDPWMPLRSFIQAFNACRASATFKPGSVIVVDELMSMWEGAELKHYHFGCPHVTKIKSKPVSVGIECKCSCDGESGVMLFLDIQEGRIANNMKLYADEFKFHTAVTLRCTMNWKNTWRLVVADSAFSSVDTAIALLRNGLHFIGVVKTAHTKFPKDFFDLWEASNPEKGKSLFMVTTTEVDGTKHTLLASDWICRKQGKRLISTCSSGAPGEPQIIKYSKTVQKNGTFEDVQKEWSSEITKVYEDMFEHFSAIDVHDHYRQGILQLELHWRTQTWWHRLLATVLGVIFTDCYFIYRHEFHKYNEYTSAGAEGGHEMLSYEKFLSSLCKSMIFNDIDTSGWHLLRRHDNNNGEVPTKNEVRWLNGCPGN